MIRSFAVLLAALLATAASAGGFQDRVLPSPAAPGKDVTPFVVAPAGVIALTHIRVIDGTGAALQEDKTLVIDGTRIAAVQPPSVPPPSGAHVIDLHGDSVLPGLVGMHDHLFYIARPNLTPKGTFDAPLVVPDMLYSAPRLYLAGGVTTLRTTGSVELYADLNLKHQIDEGLLPVPHLDVTGPYLEGDSDLFIQMHRLTGPDDARRMVDYWAAEGATSFKGCMHITRDKLPAAVAEAHRLGLKVTAHLCAVTYREAAALGVDDLEHGLFVDTEDDPGKEPGRCTPGDRAGTVATMKAGGAEARRLIADLVSHHVAITSTLPVFEVTAEGRPALSARMREAMSRDSASDYDRLRAAAAAAPAAQRAAKLAAFRNGMALEREFVAAGGLLLAGPDPTGAGDVAPGFSNQRELELLVEAGFTPLEAIRIGTLNGATYEGLANRIGSIAPGKNAHLVVMRGDPARRVSEIESVAYVFKDGVGYDPAKLLGSVAHAYRQY